MLNLFVVNVVAARHTNLQRIQQMQRKEERARARAKKSKRIMVDKEHESVERESRIENTYQ